MGSTFTATAAVDLFANPSHTVALSYFTTFDLLPFPHFETHFVFGFSGGNLPRDGDPIDAMEDFASAQGEGLYFLTVFAGNAVDYSQSTAPVFIDLQQATQHGGFAEGDRFFDGTMTGIDGSSFDDVIRGIDPLPNPEDLGITTTFNNPGNNIFNGGGGNDLLEGRGGADTLNGQGGFDLASYESSPAGVTVRLAGVNGDTQTALASGGDAAGDKLSSIEGLIGSGGGDRLTGNSLDNLLAGGLGSDILNGMNGTDTADYSRDHFFDLGDTADRVEVHLAPGAGAGRVDEFKLQGDGTFKGVSTDALISIENVIGTAGNDIIVGNEFDNRLEGRGGSNDLDGGLGNDVLVGGSGIDTANYTSHDALAVERGEQYVISLGLVGRPGSFTLSEPGSRPVPLQVVETDVLIGIENVTGSNHAETITGNERANTLDGRGGSDILDGGFGDDLLIGNSGTDTASYLSHDGLLDDGSPDVISLGNGTSDGSYTRFQAVGPIRQAVETDVLRSIENVTGSDSNEIINGNDGINVLDGRGGNDIIDGGLGNDILIGNDGIDTASYVSHDATPLPEGGELDAITLGLGEADGSYFRNQIVLNLFRTLETDVLRGFENATGSNKDEIITGNERDNVLDGRGGTDTIDGGLGNDVIIGGTGLDSVSYASHDSLPLLPGEINLLQLGLGDADGSYTRFEIVNGALQVVETDVLRGIENVIGGSHSEIIIGNEQDNTLRGNGGNDIIDGGLGNDIIIGGDPVFVIGSGLRSSIDTASYVSHDGVTDFFGADLIALGQNGADGSYTRLGQTGTVETDVLRGIENVTGSNRIEVIIGNDQDNTLEGRGGNDHLVGGAGDDTVNGGADGDVYDFTGVNLGSDRFFDESGADAVVVNSFSDILPDGTGRDGNDLVVHLTTGTFRIVDHFNGHQIEAILASDTGQSMVLANGLIGGNGNGIIAGTHKGETLDGRGGDDFLFGGNGRDRLIGGDGNDRLTGGHGPDTFVFGPGFGHDVVTDYNHADHIEFDGGVFHNLHQVQAASHQVGNDTVITLDANNSITLLGVNSHSLHSDDFTFV
jgi:Ca2+-binding RTX toxin-like protein